MEIVIASFSESYPQSQPIILTPNFCDHTTASNNIVDLLNKYLTDEKLSKLYLVSPTGRVKILESLLGPLFQLEKSKKEPVWYITEGIPIKKSTNVAYLNNGNPASSTHQLQDPLAKSISEFMNSVSNLPLEKRAAAVRDQIESPVFSADYKRHLISKVRSMSHLFKPCTTISTEKNSKKISEDSPVSENSIKRIWCGTLEFKLESTFSVQAIATHLANPKIIGKTLDIKDFYPETWPSRLKITGSIPLSSQLIHKFAPRSLFVEIGAFDLNCNDSMITLGSLYKFLDTRNLSGVIKIGEKLIVLIIPKGKGLVGMLINRDHFSSEMGHPNTAMQSSVHPNPKSEVQFGSIAKMNNNSTLNNAHQQPSKIPVEVRKLTLTPEDIIRQKLGLANSFSSTLSPANMSNSFSANSSFAPTRKPSPPPNLMIHDNRFTGNQRSPIKNHPNMSTAGVPTSNPMNGNINQMNDTRFGKLQGNNEISLDIDDLRCDLIDGNHGDHVTFYADDSFFG